jgi:hypothetical protein
MYPVARTPQRLQPVWHWQEVAPVIATEARFWSHRGLTGLLAGYRISFSFAYRPLCALETRLSTLGYGIDLPYDLEFTNTLPR